MNYLAHLFLSPESAESRLGNACADYVKGAIPDTFPTLVRNGIRLHRSVDAFADSHPVLTECASLFPSQFNRYAGIMLDVTFDHLLARSWDEFATIGLDEFVSRVYRDLQTMRSHAPPGFLPVLESMTRHDWLSSYRHPESVTRMLTAISSRLRRANPLAEAASVVFQNEAAIEVAFRRFLPDLIGQALQLEPDAAPHAL